MHGMHGMYGKMNGSSGSMKDYKINTGTAKPETPVSHRTGSPPGGASPSYNPAAAAKALNQPPPKC